MGGSIKLCRVRGSRRVRPIRLPWGTLALDPTAQLTTPRLDVRSRPEVES